MDANYGCLLKEMVGALEYVPQNLSGLSVRGDVKSLVELEIAGKTILLSVPLIRLYNFIKNEKNSIDLIANVSFGKSNFMGEKA
jgi:hypothetical protein